MKAERFKLCCNKSSHVKAYVMMTLSQARARNVDLFVARSSYRWRLAKLALNRAIQGSS